MAYKPPPLRFGYDARGPSIDAETMELHHDKRITREKGEEI